MRQFRLGPFWRLLAALILFWIGFLSSPAAAKSKMKPEELLARHLAALGSPEARASATTRVLEGTAWVTFRLGGTGRSDGTAAFASEGRKTRLMLSFDHPEYPAELLVYDGKRVGVGLIRPSVPSVYRLRVPAFIAQKPAESGRMRESYWKMTEEFSDFKSVDGLTLPHAYRLVLNYEGEIGSSLAIWEAKFSRIVHNQPLTPDVFATR